jgi:predicted ATP-grasp superfamily ATP-dependent carboligase
MSLVIARSLGKKDIEIIGADCIGVTMLSMSKYVKHHEVYTNFLENEAAFIDDLIKIVVDYKPEDGRPYLLFPVFKETVLIARNVDKFSPHIQVVSPGIDSINSIFPKKHFTQTARKIHVNIPKTYLPQEIQDTNSIMNYSQLPLLLKPGNESGGKGIIKVHNRQELDEAFNEHHKHYNQPPLVQEVALGEDYCFTAICDRGVIKACMAYKNISRFPAKEGSGVVRETVDETPFLHEADKLLSFLKWHGIVQIDFVWTGNPGDVPVMIEVNPRFWAGLFQSVASGIDYPWLAYLLFTGQDIPKMNQPKKGTKTKIPMVWVLSVIQESIELNRWVSEIKEASRSAINDYQEHQSFFQALKRLFNEAKENVHNPFKKQIFGAKWQDAKNAEDEILNSDDPKAAMGITYSLIYLAKYHKLPPETGL